jgi:flavin reductase (DIM6/NTAB) family NADH-FMN oxidoreductase RutF
MMVAKISQETLIDLFKASMRVAAASVSLVTARDEEGNFHGMAVTSASSLSMDPPSMVVAVNRSASVHPVISSTGQFSLNLMHESHHPILQFFSRSDMRDKRFATENWQEGPDGLPVLRGALCTQICSVDGTLDYGTHTIFIGRVQHVLLPESDNTIAPLVWMNGSRSTIAPAAPIRS